MLKIRRRAHSILLERGTSLALEKDKEHTGRTRGLGKRTTWKQRFEEDRHMYKKHGRDRETNLELQVKALVAKTLVDVLPPIASHGGTRGSMFGLRRMPNSMVNARHSRFILVQALDRRSSNNLTSSRP